MVANTLIMLLKMLKQIVPKGQVCKAASQYKNCKRKQGQAAKYTQPKGNCNEILCKYLAGKDIYRQQNAM